jgi:hypothetical protein
LLNPREFPVDSDLDAEFVQVREKFPPLRVAPDLEAAGGGEQGRDIGGAPPEEAR